LTLGFLVQQLAMAYSDVAGRDAGGSLVQRTFLAALAKRVDDVLSNPHILTSDIHNSKSKTHTSELISYLDTWQWPFNSAEDKRIQRLLFACYLCWYGIPRPQLVTSALQHLAHELPGFPAFSASDVHSTLPLLALVLPGTPMPALLQINDCLPFLSLTKFM
jgi:hypothetical protein